MARYRVREHRQDDAREHADAESPTSADEFGDSSNHGTERGFEDTADGEAAPAVIPDLLRKAVALGLSSFFTTEEAIRRAVNDTLPKDWVDFAVDQSERTRDDVIRRMTEEFGQVLQKVEFSQLLEQLLDGRTIEVNAQIRLAPKDPDQPSPFATQTQVGVKPEDDDGAE